MVRYQETEGSLSMMLSIGDDDDGWLRVDNKRKRIGKRVKSLELVSMERF